MRIKRIISVLLAALMLSALFYGCKKTEEVKKDETEKQTTTKQADKETTSAEEEDEFAEEIEFSVTVFEAEKWGNEQDDVHNYIYDKFNVDIEFVPITWDDWNEKLTIWITSGDMPDYMQWDFQSANFGDYTRWAKQGALKALPEFGDKYPNIQRLMEPMKKMVDKLNVDGKLYMFPKRRQPYEDWGFETFGYMFRKDWAEEIGFTKDEVTWDEFIDLAKLFMEKDPGGNGPGKTIGIALTSWAYPNHLGLMELMPYFDRYFRKDGEYVWGAAQPETLQGIKIMKDMYDQGVLWEDFYTGKADDAWAMYVAGKLGIYGDDVNVGYFNWMRDDFKAANPDIDEKKAVSLLQVKGPGGGAWGGETALYWTTGMFSSDVSDKKLERILYLLDWIGSEEGMLTTQLGLEGRDWNKNGDEIELLWPKKEDGSYEKPYFAEVGIGMTMWTLIPDFFDKYNPQIPKPSKDHFEQYMNRRAEIGANIRYVDYELEYLDAPYKETHHSAIKGAVKDEIKKIIVASDDVEGDWNAFIESMMPQVQPLLDELNTLVK